MMRRATLTIPTLMMSLTLALAPACEGSDEEGPEEAAGDTEEGDGDEGGDVNVDEGGDDAGDDAGDFGGGDDGEPMGCVVHETEDACSSAAGCNAVYGSPLVEMGEGSWCTDAEEYIGCVNAGDLCPPLMKVLCGGEDELWQTDQCVPSNLTACTAPGDITGPC
ncbi:hypothetical protein PPSIR1_28138 [Plesiocystis pacifica SIR-1]|uniref:Lipoprotein n=1 Tax=Plesiocystis pacifica SIR-1 TaxID=391625 RepID=A6FZQ0_9BACT|nr:hypothetical protein [Plesiocystis pacifica]EDM80856.1 hypothetical protein PPSIR1_28138 [Plesiocystis pacifica SIR-1]